MIFGMLNLEKIWHEHLTYLSTSSVICSHFTLGNPKSHFQRTSDYLRYLTSTPPENVTTLTCQMQNFFIWLKVCCISSNVGGSGKNRLWCVATGMSGKRSHRKCSKWPPSVWIRASSLFCHWSVASYTRLCWNLAHFTTSRSRNLSVSLTGTGYIRSSCSMPQTPSLGLCW